MIKTAANHTELACCKAMNTRLPYCALLCDLDIK